jgi:hypothetical protein
MEHKLERARNRHWSHRRKLGFYISHVDPHNKCKHLRLVLLEFGKGTRWGTQYLMPEKQSSLDISASLCSCPDTVRSGNLRDWWVSQYPIPHRQHYEPCTLRRGDTRPHKSAMGLTDKMLSRLLPPNQGQTDQLMEESLHAWIHHQWKEPT